MLIIDALGKFCQYEHLRPHTQALVAPVITPLCRNPNGFMWAGDTAQTIAVESVFTFEQLGALLYRFFVCVALSQRQS